MHNGKLIGIAIRSASRAPMEPIERAEISDQTGVASDFRGKPGGRQVTVMSSDAWKAACGELGQEIPWLVRRANLLVSGLDFANSAGSQIKLGDVVLEVTMETEPCPRMDEQVAGLSAALEPDWRGGVCCRVVQGGSIAIGDAVTLQS